MSWSRIEIWRAKSRPVYMRPGEPKWGEKSPGHTLGSQRFVSGRSIRWLISQYWWDTRNKKRGGERNECSLSFSYLSYKIFYPPPALALIIFKPNALKKTHKNEIIMFCGLQFSLLRRIRYASKCFIPRSSHIWLISVTSYFCLWWLWGFTVRSQIW